MSRFFMIALGSLLLGARTFATPVGADACSYAIHTPEAVLAELRNVSSDLGIASIAPYTFALSVQGDRWIFLRRGALVARVGYLDSSLNGSSSLIVYDVLDKPLFTLKELVYQCPTEAPEGLCKAITLNTNLEPAGENEPFMLVESNSGFEYLRYGKSVDAPTWRTNFKQAVGFVIDYLSKTDVTSSLPATTYSESFLYTLAEDPQVAPYLEKIGATYSQDGGFKITGRLPQGIYDLIVDDAIAAGFPNIDPEVTIDSAATIPPPSSERVENCIPY